MAITLFIIFAIFIILLQAQALPSNPIQSQSTPKALRNNFVPIHTPTTQHKTTQNNPKATLYNPKSSQTNPKSPKHLKVLTSFTTHKAPK